MEAPKPAMTTQPQAVQMSLTNPPARAEHQHQQGKASRLRGGGAAKDCFLGAFECFICFGATAASVSLTSSAALVKCSFNFVRNTRSIVR
ncbi:hypothetical protein AcW2_007344 [Taiwanofungus camphoratus]|nr:hypothetical protein AcW2_007344 [Antrodia cinnamomea]